MRDTGRTRERLVGVALAGGIALNFPLLYLLDDSGSLLGIPALYLYVFLVWAGLIGLVALIIHAPTRDQRGESGEIKRDPPRG